VSVVCRVRPLNENEQKLLAESKLKAESNHKDMCVEFNPEDKCAITVYTPNDKQDKDPYEKHEFRLDHVFECDTDQATVYEIAAKPIVNSVLEGFNGTVLAYGQTSSGKTFTMQGDIDSDNFRGIIPRMIETIFQAIAQASENMEFTVKASMIEIYNEKVRDLLDPSKDNLSVHEDKQRGVYVDGLTETSIGAEYDVYDLMRTGNSNRAIAETKMNAQSSRSHSIFILTMVMNDLESLSCKTGKLYLVDLAGSEMISKTGASGQTLEEAKNINKSLTMLGRVITALTDGKSAHIPYRDSKLTRILQDSLGGNSKTCLIVTASPSMYNASETLSTCRFGVRAKSIKNNAKINKQVTLAELKLAIINLEKELELRNRKISNLEAFLISKGLIMSAADEEKLYGNDLDKIAIDETLSDTRTTFSTDIGLETVPSETTSVLEQKSSPSKENYSVSVGGEIPFEEEKKAGNDQKLPAAAVIKMYNQLEQQRDLLAKPQIEKEKEEQQNDIDTLINQLRQERKKAKQKDEKLNQLRKDLASKTSEIELVKAESEKIFKDLQEKQLQIEELKKSFEDFHKNSPQKTDHMGTFTEPIRNSENNLEIQLLNEIIADPEIDSKIKEKIKNKSSKFVSLDSVNLTEQKIETTKNSTMDEEKKLLIEKNAKLKRELAEINIKLLKEREFNKKQIENNSTSDEFRRKLTVLQKNIEQASKLYTEHRSKIEALSLEIKLKNNKIERLSKKLADSEKQIGKLREDLSQHKELADELKKAIWENVPNAKEILEHPVFTKATPFYVYNANLVKRVRGGGGIFFFQKWYRTRKFYSSRRLG